MRHLLFFLFCCGTALGQEPTPPAPQAPAVEPRIRTITRLHNSMSQPLVGIGIVTGLAKTGASERATRQALLNMIRREGLQVGIADVVAGAVALCSVTATLPPFARQGQPIDVKVEVLGDALSLRGGELLRCELRAVDGSVYTVAQGPVLTSGYAVQGSNASLQKGHTTTGWVSRGGSVVRDLESSFFSASGHLELQVLNPSPFNAAAIAAGIRSSLQGERLTVYPVDPGLVRLELTPEQRTNENAMRLLNLMADVKVRVENPAKVVLDQASGTVLAGEGVMISPCVVAVSDLTISVVNEEEVSQPNPGWNKGTTERVGRTRIEVSTNNTEPKPLQGGATISDLLQNLRTLGLTPPQLEAVFRALDMGGYLHAQLEIR